MSSKKKMRAKIEEDLSLQLKARGMEDRAYYISLVKDYISFWDAKEKLIADIKKNGVSITYDHGGGQTGIKKNDSVGELSRVHRHMLTILSELGLRGANIEVADTYEPM